MSAPSLRDFLLARVQKQQRTAKDGPRLYMSAAGSDCVRRVYYQATSTPTDEPTTDEEREDLQRGLVKMALGTAMDQWALEGAPPEQLAAHRVNVQPRIEMTLGDVTVAGRADIVFWDTSTNELVPTLVSDLKVVGESTWEKVQKRPKQEHEAQVNLYGWCTGAPRWSVCYVRASTGEILEHFGNTDAFAARKEFGLFEEVALWFRRGTPPPRPYEDIEEEDGTVKVAKDGFPCAWCDYRATCWAESNEKGTTDEPVQEA